MLFAAYDRLNPHADVAIESTAEMDEIVTLYSSTRTPYRIRT